MQTYTLAINSAPSQLCSCVLAPCAELTGDEGGVGAHVWLDVRAQHPLHHLLSALPLAIGAQGCSRRGAGRGAGESERWGSGLEGRAGRNRMLAAAAKGRCRPAGKHSLLPASACQHCCAPLPPPRCCCCPLHRRKPPTSDQGGAGHDVGAHAPGQHVVEEGDGPLPLAARGAGRDDGCVRVACTRRGRHRRARQMR